jgi:hypothetical protein
MAPFPAMPVPFPAKFGAGWKTAPSVQAASNPACRQYQAFDERFFALIAKAGE